MKSTRKQQGMGRISKAGSKPAKTGKLEIIAEYENGNGKHSEAIGFADGKLMMMNGKGTHEIPLRESVRWHSCAAKMANRQMVTIGSWNEGARSQWLRMVASVMAPLPTKMERRLGQFCQRYHINPEKFMAHAMECALNGADDDLRSIVKECGE